MIVPIALRVGKHTTPLIRPCELAVQSDAARWTISGDRDIDMIAAALRADISDLDLFLDVTANKLEDALPDHTVVKRAGWLGRRRGRVRRVDITIGEEVFVLSRHARGVQASVSHVVHGVTLATTQLDVDAWLARLAASLAKYAEGQARGREALERLLR